MKFGQVYNKIMHAIARMVFPKAKTVFEIPFDNEPAVFVCNHSGIRGPVLMTLDFHVRHKTWTLSYAMDRKKAVNYAFHDILVGDSRRFKGFYRFLSKVISIALPELLKYEPVIPVYHDSNLISTFKQSIKALNDGESLVIFAESSERYTEYINRLQVGFIDFARLYYRRSGKRINFYPVYVEKKNAVISVGKPIAYDPGISMDEQRQRIALYLCDNIDRLARRLPPHTPMPFLSQKWYDAYGERFEHDTAGYWQMIDQGD